MTGVTNNSVCRKNGVTKRTSRYCAPRAASQIEIPVAASTSRATGMGSSRTVGNGGTIPNAKTTTKSSPVAIARSTRPGPIGAIGIRILWKYTLLTSWAFEIMRCDETDTALWKYVQGTTAASEKAAYGTSPELI